MNPHQIPLSSLPELLASLPPEVLVQLDKLTSHIRWSPNPADAEGRPNPQQLAIRTEADVCGYGGAAGGGKTDLANGLAHTQHRRSLLLRRNGVDTDYMYERGKDLAPEKHRSNGVERILRHPNGVMVKYGGMKEPDSWKSHRGKPWDLIVFDEAEEFLESQVRAMLGWNRTTVPGQRVRALMCFNPPTSPEGYWLIDYFAPWLDAKHPNPAKPGELRWFVTVDGRDTEVDGPDPFDHNGEVLFPRSRTFIPSKVEDNPHLMQTGYVSALNALPEPLRSQLRHGDFAIGLDDDMWQLIPTQWIVDAQARWTPDIPKQPMDALGIDPARGGRDETVFQPRYGDYFAEPISFPGGATPDGPSIAGQAITIVRNGAPIAVDVIGIGSSVYDHLKHLPGTVAVDGSAGGEGWDKSGQLGFANLRSMLHWRLREALDPQYGRNIALPPHKRILPDLTSIHFTVSRKKIQVEGKQDIFKRLGRSPDYGDAIVYALPDWPKPMDRNGRGPIVAKTGPYM